MCGMVSRMISTMHDENVIRASKAGASLIPLCFQDCFDPLRQFQTAVYTLS